MGADAAVRAVYANRIADIEDLNERQRFVEEKQSDYEQTLGLLRLGSDLHIDAVVAPDRLRGELIERLAAASSWQREFGRRYHGVWPV
jgi:acetyl-CoA carboxylase carboxyltransferase component